MDIASRSDIEGADSFTAGTDRRKANRFKMLLSVECYSPENGDTLKLKAENISTSGLKFITHSKPFIDELLTMKICLSPPFPSLEVTGQVVWCDEKISAGTLHYEGGVEFVYISESDIKVLEFFIDRYYLISH
ncbi:MAG: PilZ domain-containing protein [Candidatus Xenobiia bacterium LiM19]